MEFVICGLSLGFSVFCLIAGVGCALKFVQWFGKKLDVKPFDP